MLIAIAAALRLLGELSLGVRLPDSSTPYGIAMLVAFLIGIYGHAAKFRWLVGISIALVFAISVLTLIAARTVGDAPPDVEIP